MKDNLDPIALVAQAILHKHGDDCGLRIVELATSLGLEVREIDATSFDGALLRPSDVKRGILVVNRKVEEQSRRRFTIAHEIGHFVLPDQQDLRTPCSRRVIESWASDLANPELDANRFAAEILMPRHAVTNLLKTEPTIDNVRVLAECCETSLTASAVRLVELSSYPAAMVWSTAGTVRWYRRSSEFGRWIKRETLDARTYAADCFAGLAVPRSSEPVPADAWLFEHRLKSEAQVWEQSVCLANYNAVLSLLIMREPVEAEDGSGPDEYEELDPEEFTIQRKGWPGKRW